MSVRGIALILCAVLALLIFAIPAASEPRQSIVVNGADEIVEASVSSDQGLLNSIAVAGPRVVVDYANHVQRMGLVTVPGSFQTVLNQVSERVAVEYANLIWQKGLVAAPGGLQTLLDQVPGRVVFQYANTNVAHALHYPRELVNDTTPPRVTEIGVGRIEASGILTITWATDEFADSNVFYGTQSGSYPYTTGDPLYVKLHAIGLTGLTPGETYYYTLRSTDLSNNASTTPEYSFTAQQSLFIYLPLVTRSP